MYTSREVFNRSSLKTKLLWRLLFYFIFPSVRSFALSGVFPSSLPPIAVRGSGTAFCALYFGNRNINRPRFVRGNVELVNPHVFKTQRPTISNAAQTSKSDLGEAAEKPFPAQKKAKLQIYCRQKSHPSPLLLLSPCVHKGGKGGGKVCFPGFEVFVPLSCINKPRE